MRVNKTLDIKGLVCPRPLEITTDTLENMAEGQILRVITNDVTTKNSIPSLCDNLGHSLLEMTVDKGVIYFTIQK